MLKVIKVIPYTDYTIEIHYSNKEIKMFDMKPLFKYEIYKPLINKNLFYTVKPFYNTITWDNDIDKEHKLNVMIKTYEWTDSKFEFTTIY